MISRFILKDGSGPYIGAKILHVDLGMDSLDHKAECQKHPEPTTQPLTFFVDLVFVIGNEVLKGKWDQTVHKSMPDHLSVTY